MAKEYGIDELSSILGLNPDKITSHLGKYEANGTFSYSMDRAGFKNYSPTAIYLIMKEEFNSSQKKSAGKIEQREGDYVLQKKSLEDLVKAAKITEGCNIYGQVEKPISDKGSGYTGKIRYFFTPTKGAEISYEETYRIDHPREADEIRTQVCEELRKITGKEKITSQIA